MTTCPTCDTAGVADEARHGGIDIVATTDALIQRVDDGRMRVVRGDVPLTDMVALLESDMKYTIVTYLSCTDCERTVFWGLCIRGAPILKHVDASRPERHSWEPVPPRERWAKESISGDDAD